MLNCTLNCNLGRDPKPLMPHMRLTAEMVECIGQKGSERYRKFNQLFVAAFLRLRRHARLFRSMLSLLASDGPAISGRDGGRGGRRSSRGLGGGGAGQRGGGGDDDGEFTMAELDAAIKERFMHGMGKTKRDKETKSKER